MITLEDFLAYAQIKAFDVISAGNFKRHLSANRDNEERWAVQMYTRHTVIQNRVKDVFTLVNQLTTPGSHLIQKICKDVMACAQPPIKILSGPNVCCLTKENIDYCIDLTRAGKNSQETLVHTRFWHFFVFLWFCAKLEYVIRACTKQWLDTQPQKPNPENYTRLCEEYTFQNTEFIEKLFNVFIKAVDYTTLSLTIFRDRSALTPTLTPPQGFTSEERTDTP